MKPFLLIFAVLGCFFTGCVAPVGLQGGRSVGKNLIATTPYLHAGDIMAPLSDSEKRPPFMPTAGCLIIAGITDRFDFGGKIDLGTTVAVQARYQILGNHNSSIAMSPGIEAGVMILPTISGNAAYYFTAPLYISFHPSERFFLFATPRFSGLGSGAKQYNDSMKFNHVSYTTTRSGFSYGFSIGKENRVIAEAGHFGANLLQPTLFSIGFATSFSTINKPNKLKQKK